MDPGPSKPPPTQSNEKPSKPKRRRNNEAKRARGEISCAECRRLKMKCDKRIPCGTCTKRGCANICPHGVLSGGQGSRLILADTQALHRKIIQMSERIRQLEDALSIMQADVSKERHPLLRGELLRIKYWPEVEDKDAVEREPNKDNTIDEVISAMGTLTVGEDGGAKYFGQSAGSESLLHLGDPLDFDLTLEPIPYFALPYSRNDTSAFAGLESALPPLPRAWALLEAYFAHASYSFRPVVRDDLVNDLMSPIYKAIKDSTEPGSVAQSSPHKLGLLFLVFALGSLMDLTLPPCSEEAHGYYQLARSVLSARSVMDSPMIETVQALALVSAYHNMSGRKATAETTWEFVGIALKLAQSIGLHRDCARWNLDAKTVRKRRYIFWEIYTTDVLLSLEVGRPPTLPLSCIDCEFPLDQEQTLNDKEEIVPGFWAWKYSVAKDLLGPICEYLANVRTSTYDTILDFDRRVRQKGLPKNYIFFVPPEHEDYHDPSACLKTWLIAQYRLIPMLYLHRPYFAQALLDHSGNPLCSQYAPSFLASYRWASVMIKRDLYYFERCPDLFLRMGGFWSHSFAAAVIMGLVVVRTPKSTMSSNALAELNAVVDLFEKGAQVNIRAQRAIPLLRNLKSKAQQAYFKSRSGSSESSTDGAEELALLSGKTKVVSSKFLSRYWNQSCGTANKGSSVFDSPESSLSTDSPSTFSDVVAELPATADKPRANEAPMVVHPSLVNYLSGLPHEEINGLSTLSFEEGPFSMDWAQTMVEEHFPELVRQFVDPFSQYSQVPMFVEVPVTYPTSAQSFNSTGPGGDTSSSFEVVDDFTGLYPGLGSQDNTFTEAHPSSDLGMDQQFISLMQSAGLFDNAGGGQS